jgi:glutamine amidotransferase
MVTAIIDYGSGNLRSAAKAFERAARDSDIDTSIRVTSDPREVLQADRVILPGVGAFADCRRGLAVTGGMEDALQEAVVERGRPFLGICVGMQLMAERGHEFVQSEGLGWIPGDVVKIPTDGVDVKIPHMGWNELQVHADHPVLAGLGARVHVYFVHSFHFSCAVEHDVLASVQYSRRLSAVIGRGNLIGTQFHPEKSQAAGLRLIANFLRWHP